MKKRKYLAAVILGTGALVSCSLTPDYLRPDAGLPKEAPVSWEQGVKAQKEESDLNAGWWHGFGSDTLLRLQKAGLAQNHDFAARGWQLAQAVAQARVARAPLFPWLGAEVHGSRLGEHDNRTHRFSMTDTVSGSFQASYEVDIWGKLRSQADSASFIAEATLNDWRAAGLSLESDIALAYFYLLGQKERLAVQSRILDAARQMLDYMEKRHRAGAASPLDIARQKSDVAAMEARVEELERVAQAATNNLNNLLGNAVITDELSDAIRKEKLTDLLAPAVPAGLPSDLLIRRPDILSAEAMLKSANADIGAARAAFLPSIFLTAQGGTQSSSLHNLFHSSSLFYALASSLVAPIFEGGRLEAQLDITLARREEMVARYQQAALSAFLEVDTAIAANAFLMREEKKRREASEQAQEAYRIVSVRYAAGAEEFLAVLDAQRTMLNAEDAVVTVALARLNASAGLFKALGGGWAESLPPENISSGKL
ncbi:efflux transporter outer membrane subunit [Oxalobacter sp. OttesenSCG-928-P03]|nr:efflux transporter outer membrane subunit [Oxalobacter sp. OttesenSCG-928-P03]